MAQQLKNAVNLKPRLASLAKPPCREARSMPARQRRIKAARLRACSLEATNYRRPSYFFGASCLKSKASKKIRVVPIIEHARQRRLPARRDSAE